ncbi:MAG: hypothetical protein ACTSU5_00645 [Promethearchaeota archaeon]
MIHLIRVESSAAPARTRQADRVKTILILAQFLIMGINLLYGILRWLKFIGALQIEELWMGQMWNFVILFMAFWLAVTFVLTRRYELVARDSREDKASHPEGDGGLAREQSGDGPGDDPVKNDSPDTTKEAGEKSMRVWRRFELSVFFSTLALGIVGSVRWNAFYPFIDFGESARYFRESSFWTVFLDRAVEVDVLLLIFYASMKIPLAAGSLSGTFNRLYIGKWRVHESVFGILWILLGSLFVLYGQFFDRVLGIFYILMGAFFMGRDYLDVQKFKFIKDASKPGKV